MQVLYRGQLYPAQDLEALGLQIRHLATNAALAQQGIVAGFDSEEEAVAYLQQPPEESPEPRSATAVCEKPSYLYDGIHGFRPPRFPLGPGEGLLSLRDVAGENWNARIRSLTVFDCPGTLTLYEHCGFEGKTLTFVQNTAVDSLAQYAFTSFSSWSNKAHAVRSIRYFHFSAHDTNGAQANTLNAAVTLRAGQSIQLGTCGVPGASGHGDTYLRLYDAQGNEVSANDDSCGGRSFISHTVLPGTAGTYEIRAGCFGNTACSGTVAYTFFSPLSAPNQENPGVCSR